MWVWVLFHPLLPTSHQTHPHCLSLTSLLPWKRNMLSMDGDWVGQVGMLDTGGHSVVLRPWVMLNLSDISVADLDVLPVCPDSICSGGLCHEHMCCLCTIWNWLTLWSVGHTEEQQLHG
jgi:hypothetical protein